MSRLSQLVVIAIAALALVLALSANLSGPNAARAVDAEQDASATPPEARVATCAVTTIADALMESDRFKPDRTEYEQELTAQLTPIREQLQALGQEMQTASPQDEGVQQKQQQFYQLQQQFEQTRNQLVQQMETFIVNQYQEAYDLVRSSARAVAEERGFNYVLASLDAEGEVIEGQSMESVRRDVLGRPVVMAPEGVDISDDVRADLKLE